MMHLRSEEERRLDDLVLPWLRLDEKTDEIRHYLDPEAPESVKAVYDRWKQLAAVQM